MGKSTLQNALKDIQSKLQELDKTQLIVGVQAESGTNFNEETVSSNTEMLKIAYVHEFGYDITVTPKMRAYLHTIGIHLKKSTKVIHIPERSFIRSAHKNGKADFNKTLTDAIGRLFKDGSYSTGQFMNDLGRQALTNVVGNLGAGTAPLSEITIKRRVATDPTPLNDKGTLQNHITYRIKKGGQ